METDAVARRRSPEGHTPSPPLSRKRTAELLKELRSATKDLKMLKVRIETAQHGQGKRRRRR